MDTGWLHKFRYYNADNTKEKNSLQGKTIVLDPGHGGSDQGASSSTKSPNSFLHAMVRYIFENTQKIPPYFAWKIRRF